MSQKIIIRTPNHLGDCIMALPMVNETKEVYPATHLTVLTPEYLADLYIANPSIDEILTIPQKYVHGLVSITKIKELLKDKNYDIGYILPPSFGAAAGFKLAGIKKRIGYIADGRRLLLSKPLPLPMPINSVHRSELYYNLLRRGTGQDIEYVKPKLFLNDTDMGKVAMLLENYDIPRKYDFVALSFRAVAESRRWGKENYINLIKRIIAELHLKVVLVGTEDDKKTGDEIVSACGHDEVKNMAGVTSIREVAAVISLAKLFVGNDSGPAHIAAAVGVPIVVLSGADDPKSTSPMASDKVLLYQDKLECISCVKNICPKKGESFMACMSEISVDRTFQAVQLLLP
ncbi:MAG TPA: lipopolysaccharide heptosyltransferase II [candidate division Zixibacteria bacterium]|nr:lipopolysaccharide heptosyltransferase II [candidate division Zixibacteria bacterium]